METGHWKKEKEGRDRIVYIFIPSRINEAAVNKTGRFLCKIISLSPQNE